MSPSLADAPLYVGLDCSTQSMSGIVVNAQGRVVYESSLRFDEAFPSYGTENGVLRFPGKDSEVVIPSMMFVEALDAILKDLGAHVNLVHVAAVSGSAQQHASVFWNKGFSLGECLDAATGDETIADVLNKQPVPVFLLENGPSWMDSSTTQFCNELESAVGGPDRVAQISGSRAYERFTGNQIAKRIHDDASFLDNVGRIALVSSMLTTLLLGEYTPIDESDGSGMNLLDVRERKWSPELLRATAQHHKSPDAEIKLQKALGEEICRSYDSLGVIHRYFQRKYGFAPNCKVIPFSGDNPCTLAGIGLSQAGDVGISLGTSSTLMAVVPTAEARFSGEEGHFFRNPVDPDTLMAMICFKNGSLTRQEVRDRRADKSWAEFDELLAKTEAGNSGVTGFYFLDPEITPSTTKAGTIGFDAEDSSIDLQLSPAETEVRAVVESQFLSMRLHAERLGVKTPKRLIVVGGASANTSLLQVLADVFDAPVYRLESVGNSAALGGAFRAMHGAASAGSNGFVPFDVTESLDFSLSASPNASVHATYTKLLARFERLEEQAVRLLS